MSGALVVLIVVLLVPAQALAATTRYAEPGGVGPEPCLESDPCDIQVAIEAAAVVDGDEIVIAPGTYNLGTGTIQAADHNLNIHGVQGQPKPVITSSNPDTDAVFLNGSFSTLKWVLINHTPSISGGLGDGLMAFNATIEQVEVTSGNTGMSVFGGVVRDSTIRSTSGLGSGAFHLSAGGGAWSVKLRNVTAVANAGPAISAEAASGAQITVDARNTIASSAGATDAKAATTGGSTATVSLSHSNYDQRLATGTGAAVTDPGSENNQTTAPVFVDAAAGDYRQASSSPTINSGITDPDNGSRDFEGQPRPQGGRIDIGADEFETAPTVSIDGPGSTEDSTPAWSFTADEGVTFECRIDEAGWTPCGSGTSGTYTAPPLSPGSYTFWVTATDSAGSVGNASRSFSVVAVTSTDTPPPTTGTSAEPFPRTLSIRYSKAKGKFKGKLASQLLACNSDQKVRVFEKKTGKDPKLGSATTNHAGKYSLKEKNAEGRFYASVKPRRISAGSCLAAKSKSIKVG